MNNNLLKQNFNTVIRFAYVLHIYINEYSSFKLFFFNFLLENLEFRMNTNNTPIGYISSRPLLEHNDNQSSVHQVLSNEIVLTSQRLTPFTTTNMIPNESFRIRNNVPAENHLTQAQLSLRRRRQRQHQRRRERRQEQWERQQQQEQRQRQRQEVHRQRQRQEAYHLRQQQLQQQQRRPRYRQRCETESQHEYWESVGFEDYMEKNRSPILEAYEWEKMDPTERQDRWDQDNLTELKRTMPVKQQARRMLVQDEMEQLQNIATAQTIIEEEVERKRERNNQQLLDLEQWKHIQFLLQQMAQPHTYHG